MSGAGHVTVTAVLLTLLAAGTGSTRAYTDQQIEDSFAPADRHPHEHPLAAQLTLQEMIDIAAYIGSLRP